MSEKMIRKIHEALRASNGNGLSTGEILDFVNANTKHGTTMNELSPLLSQDPLIDKSGTVPVERLNRRRTRQCIWKWRE
jgi:hypothetical protein